MAVSKPSLQVKIHIEASQLFQDLQVLHTFPMLFSNYVVDSDFCTALASEIRREIIDLFSALSLFTIFVRFDVQFFIPIFCGTNEF